MASNDDFRVGCGWFFECEADRAFQATRRQPFLQRWPVDPALFLSFYTLAVLMSTERIAVGWRDPTK